MIEARPTRGGTIAWLIPNATVFVSSACMMVLELVAGRLVARYLGASLYTWTSAIGVFLAGIAIGNYAGGRIADRYDARKALSTLFLLCSACCVAVPVINNLTNAWLALYSFSYPMRVGLHVALVFILPSAFLGTISPVAAKMALELGGQTGRTIGDIYAWGMIGSIVGTFLTGYILIAAFGTIAIVWGAAFILAMMGILYGLGARRSWAWAAALAALFALAHATGGWPGAAGKALALRTAGDPNTLYSDESQYSYIEIRRDSSLPGARWMLLDQLVHSTVIMDDPLDLKYGYEQVYAAITHRLAGSRARLRTLMIGGGGFVFPRYLEAKWPRSVTEVAEIDPRVTEAAIRAFGLPAKSPIQIHHIDGRAFVDELVRRKRRKERVPPYDFIYGDAINHVTVPFQLTTREFYREVRDLLAPHGAFMLNMIDTYDGGRFLPAMLATLESVFPHVAVYVMGPIEGRGELWATFVLVGTKRPFEELDVCEQPGCEIARLSEAELAPLRTAGRAVILTDDYAPVENLLARVAKIKFARGAAATLLTKAVESFRQGDARGARRYSSYLLRVDPPSSEDHRQVATIYARLGMKKDAEQVLQGAILFDPLNPGLYHQLAVLLVSENRFPEAMPHYMSAMRLERSNYNFKASFERDLAAEISRQETRLRRNPRDGPAHRDLAFYYYMQDDYQEAIRHSDEAMRLGARVNPQVLKILESHRRR